eukprot:70595_1
MTSLKDTNKWIQLCLLPQLFVNHVVNTNPNEFIVIYTSPDSRFKSYKYNVQTDIFNTFIEHKYTKNQYFEFISHITFNETDQTLFVRRDRQIHSIQILTREKKSYNYEQDGPHCNYFLAINNYIHMINSHNRYLVSSIENNKLKTLHNTLNDNSDSKQVRTNGVAIYVSSKQCILLIGGYYDFYGRLINEIWKYCLSSQKWTQM